MMKPYTVYILVHVLSTSVLCQSFYPEFLTEREALALLAAEDEQSSVSKTSSSSSQQQLPADVKTSATAAGESSGISKTSHESLGEPRDPKPPSSPSHHHEHDFPSTFHNKYYANGMDHGKQEEKGTELKAHHHTDDSHKNHHSEDKGNEQHHHQDHKSDHKDGHSDQHKHGKEEKGHEEQHHKKGKKKSENYYRRPQYDEVIEPHQILLEPHHPLTHLEPDPHHMYHKNIGYDYGGGEVAYRSDFYWLIPLVIIIGIGALLLPLLSMFMTIMVSQGAISLTGRRKRSFMDDVPALSSESILKLITEVESAISKFNSQKSRS